MVLCALALAAALAPAAAYATTFSAVTPAPGSAVGTNRPYVSVYVTGTVPITSANLRFDGTAQGVQSVDFPIGHWEFDGYDYYWAVDDSTQARITASFPNGYAALPWGSINVTATVNATSTYSWQFTTNPAPVITTVTPVPSAYLTDLSPVISATVSDDGPVNGIMTVDGSPVVLTHDLVTGTFSYTPSVPFPDHTGHLVSFTAIDSYNITTSRDWSFRLDTDAPVAFSQRTPGASQVTTKPVTSVEVIADDAVFSIDVANPYNRLIIDGQPATTTVTYPLSHWENDGYSEWFVLDDPTVVKLFAPVSFTLDGTHTVTARVMNTHGLTAEDNWTFAVGIPPVISDLMPAKGTPITTPTISAKVTDNDPTAPTVTMKVDDVAVTSTFDPATGYVTYTPAAPLSDNTTHTATVDVVEASGVTATKTWSFLVKSDAQATFMTKFPVPGSTTTNSYVSGSVSATSSFELSATTAKMYVDGQYKWTSGSLVNPYRVNMWCQNQRYVDGAHVMKAVIDDAIDVRSESSWTFNVQEKPQLFTPVPSAGTTVGVEFPPMGISVSDNTPGNVNLRLTLDGTVVANQSVPQGAFSWTPGTGLVDGSSHNLVALATDAAGNTQTYSWTFKVGAAPPMSNADACTACHTTYPMAHPMNNCTTCHGYGGYHGTGPAPTPAGACLGCHEWNHGWTYIANMPCASCHTPACPTVPRHDPVPTETKHSTSTPCTKCHSASLTVEHGKYPSTSPYKYQCTVCHASSNTDVRATIASKSTACPSCHKTGTNHTSFHTSTPKDSSCTKCHTFNLVTEHVTKHKLSCKVCHGRNFPFVGEGAETSTTIYGDAAVQTAAQVAVSDSKLTKPTSAGTNLLTTASTNWAGLDAAIQAGNTSCDACHAAMPHGTRSDCETCHGKIPPTTDSTAPTSTPPPGSTYSTWSSAGPNASVPTPHSGYSLTSEKCAVCHAVHYASQSGELLLRGTAKASCEYCHIYTTIGGIVLYGGDPIVYYGIHDDESHNRTSHSACTSCHSVHGAMTMAGANATKILWDWSASGRSSYSTQVLEVWPDPANLSDDNAQITAFCTGCHATFTRSYAETLSIQQFDHQVTYDWKPLISKSHVMTDTAGGQTDPASSLPSGTPVAWANSNYCRSCHNAGNTDQGPGVHFDSFPHYTQGYLGFMTAGTSIESSGSGNLSSAADGLCLKCHRAGTQGVGNSF
jgi:hypothetical protein